MGTYQVVPNHFFYFTPVQHLLSDYRFFYRQLHVSPNIVNRLKVWGKLGYIAAIDHKLSVPLFSCPGLSIIMISAKLSFSFYYSIIKVSFTTKPEYSH